MLTIGSVYGHGFDSGGLARLEALGFRLRPQIGVYAGSQKLRFIDFASGPSLELIEIEDLDDYQAFVFQAGMFGNQVGNFPSAGVAPACPEIDDQRLTAELLECRGPVVEVKKRCRQ